MLVGKIQHSRAIKVFHKDGKPPFALTLPNCVVLLDLVDTGIGIVSCVLVMYNLIICNEIARILFQLTPF